MGTLADANPTKLSKRSQAVPLQDGTGGGIFLTDNSLGVEIFTLGLLICPNQEVTLSLMNISSYK